MFRRITKCSFLLGVVLAITGCKIEVTVPAGGYVTTGSGTYTCYKGQTCVVDVRDTFFNETFIAIPESGYTFISWKKKERAFCGASKDPCIFNTTGFGPYEALMAFLNSDETFYLEPVFAKIDGSTTGLRIYHPGDVIRYKGVASIEQIDGDGGTFPITVIMEILTSNITYKDKNIRAMRTTILFNGRQSSSTAHFFQESNGELYDLVNDDGNYLYDSGVGRFGLLSYPSPMVPYSSLATQFLVLSKVWTALETGTSSVFVSPEQSITVPLGTFSAFPEHFEESTSYLTYSGDRFPGDYDEEESTEWVSPQKGMIKLQGTAREYRYDGLLESVLTLDLQAVESNL